MNNQKKENIQMTSEQKKAFMPVLIGLIIFSIITSANTAFSSTFVLFSNKFNIPVTTAVIGNSFLTGASFLMMQYSGTFISKFGVRKSMMIAFTGVTLGFIICAVAPNMAVAYIGYALAGTIQAFGQANAYASAIRNWIVPRYQGRYIGLIAGVGSFGTAIWPILGGFLFDRLGLKEGFFALIPFYLIPAIIVICFLIKDRAEDCGVKPIGWTETDSIVNPAASQTSVSEKKFNLLKSKAFWICSAGAILTVVLFSQLTLIVTCLQMSGMSATMASTVNSIIGLLAFPVNIVAGRLLDKYGLKAFTSLFYGMVAICSVCIFFFFTNGSILFLVLFVVTNALCRPYIAITAYASGKIFGKNATVAQVKLTSVTSLGAIIITPLISSLAEKWGGYTNITWIWAIAAIASIFVWALAVKVGNKETAASADA